MVKKEDYINSFIINAESAHKMTDKKINDDIECLKPIMNKIKESINQKKYSCYISGSTKGYIINKLNSLGYKTKLIQADPRDPRETDIYEISW